MNAGSKYSIAFAYMTAYENARKQLPNPLISFTLTLKSSFKNDI